MTSTLTTPEFVALANAIPSRDPRTDAHLHRTSCLTVVLAEALGLLATEPTAERLALAARLQGLGKLMISDTILDKTEPLGAEDWAALRQHPEFAAAIIRQVPSFAPVAEIVEARYEWWDGSGYPRGLRGDAIPWEARVLAVAGSLDAMTATRAYRAAHSPAEAMAELQRGRGSQFDPAIVDRAIAIGETLTAVLTGRCPHATTEPPGPDRPLFPRGPLAEMGAPIRAGGAASESGDG